MPWLSLSHHLAGPRGGGHEATETGLAYAPVSQAHGHNHIVQSFACCGAGGEGGHGDLGLRRFEAGGVAGMCGEGACSMCVRAGLRAVRSRLAGRVSGAAGRLRTGVCTLWCPLAQQFRTPRCILVHLAQAGSPCWRHVTDRGSLSTYPGR